jgi:hypothetical protein
LRRSTLQLEQRGSLDEPLNDPPDGEGQRARDDDGTQLHPPDAATDNHEPEQERAEQEEPVCDDRDHAAGQPLTASFFDGWLSSTSPPAPSSVNRNAADWRRGPPHSHCVVLAGSIVSPLRSAYRGTIAGARQNVVSPSAALPSTAPDVRVGSGGDYGLIATAETGAIDYLLDQAHESGLLGPTN